MVLPGDKLTEVNNTDDPGGMLYELQTRRVLKLTILRFPVPKAAKKARFEIIDGFARIETY